MTLRYYDDIRVHEQSRSRQYFLSEKEIIEFAQKWDPQPFHIDAKYALQTEFGGLIASGFHVLDICHKLACEMLPNLAVVAGMGLDEVRWLAPARPGDYLVAESTVIAKRELNSRTDAGIAQSQFTLRNQISESILTYKGTVLLQKRPLKT